MLGTAAIGVTAALPQRARATPAAISARVDAGDIGPPLSPFLYGGFLEHLRGVITDCFWSELLADRKFYYPISTAAPAPPARASGGPPGAPPRRWEPIGPASAISMDSHSAYVGEHSVAVQTAGTEPRGIAQTGLALVAGLTYQGRLVMKADPSAEVSLTLVWGQGGADRQTTRIAASSEWSTVPFSFTAHATTTEGRFGITGNGQGTVHIGTVSLMPADNIDGFRADTVALMREMGFKDPATARRELHLGLRLAGHHWRSGQTSADIGSGMERGTTKRCRPG